MSKQSLTRAEYRRAKLAKNLADRPDFKPAVQGETAVRWMETLSEEDRLQAYQLADQMDTKNHDALISFGLPAQSKMLTLTDSMLEQVKKKDIGAAGEVIAELMQKFDEVSLAGLGEEPKSFFQRLFRKHSSSIRETVSKYQRASAQIDRIIVRLERSKEMLSVDIDRLERLYLDNQDYIRKLTVYIAAGQMKLDQLYGKNIPERKQWAANDPAKIQEVTDLLQFADLLEKRVYDMKIGRETAMQNASQIRMLQHTNEVLIEKIQSSILTTIPVWKNQMSIALTMIRKQQAQAVRHQVSETNGELANRQLEFMKNGYDSTEIELAKKTQENLVLMLRETLREIRK